MVWYIFINKILNYSFIMKKLIKSSLALMVGFIGTFGSVVNSSFAIELDEASRTVQLNGSKTVVLTPEQVKRGKRLFVNTCSICHTGGITKTNPNVGLDA